MNRTVTGQRLRRSAIASSGLGIRLTPPVEDPTLQDQLDALPAGGTLDIGSQHFTNPAPVILNGGKRLVGDGTARIGIVPSANRVWQTLIVRGPSSGSGSVVAGIEIVGNAPDGEAYQVDIEAQHGLEMQGTRNFEAFDLYIHNTYGDAFAFTKNNNVDINIDPRVHDCLVDEIGRCVFTPYASTGLWIHEINSGTPSDPQKVCKLSKAIMDIEPPGNTGWLLKNMLWHDCDYRFIADSQTLPIRAGQGTTYDMGNLIFDNIHTHSGEYDVFLGPPDAAHSDGGLVDTRDGPCCFQSVGANPTVSYHGIHSPFRAFRTDGLEVHDYQMQSTGTDGLINTGNCTGPPFDFDGANVPSGLPALVDDVVVQQRSDKTGEWYAWNDGLGAPPKFDDYWKWSN